MRKRSASCTWTNPRPCTCLVKTKRHVNRHFPFSHKAGLVGASHARIFRCTAECWRRNDNFSVQAEACMETESEQCGAAGP
jgi:hypothetical protein